jgi:hypothetical protein
MEMEGNGGHYLCLMKISWSDNFIKINPFIQLLYIDYTFKMKVNEVVGKNLDYASKTFIFTLLRL